MPTIEIISVGAQYGPHLPKYQNFSVSCDSNLLTDRSLFQKELDELEGTMVHLSDYKVLPMRFCGHIIDYDAVPDNDDEHFKFTENAFIEIKDLLKNMMEQSPESHVVFLTDYQFGPESKQIKRLKSIEEIEKLNQQSNISFNTLYHIQN